MFIRIGFLAHDAGHKQIFGSRRANDVAGLLLASLAVGLGYSWWLNNHNRHHAHPSTDVKDPDANYGALAFTTGQAAGRGRFARVAYRYQAYFFFPLLLLSAVGLHVDSARYLVGRRGRGRPGERMLFAAHVVGYFSLVFWVLSPVKAVVFVLVHQALLGPYLGLAFAPNHKGMPMLEVRSSGSTRTRDSGSSPRTEAARTSSSTTPPSSPTGSASCVGTSGSSSTWFRGPRVRRPRTSVRSERATPGRCAAPGRFLRHG
jgi:Fatty acid desaturase